MKKFDPKNLGSDLNGNWVLIIESAFESQKPFTKSDVFVLSVMEGSLPFIGYIFDYYYLLCSTCNHIFSKKSLKNMANEWPSRN